MKLKTSKKKPLVITMGDPAGIGPEIILKAAKIEALPAFVAGSADVLRFYNKKIRAGADICSINEDEIAKIKPRKGNIYVLDVESPLSGKLTPGIVKKEYGEAVYCYIKKAVELCMNGKAGAIVTAPINKESLNLAGHHYPGHTELLMELTGSKSVVMMLAGGKLKVALATTHVRLKDVPSKIKKEMLVETFRIISADLKRYEGHKPRIAVCSLNPHGGEGGIFGDEEGKEIKPAIDKAVKSGQKVYGPYSADTLFSRTVSGEFDVVVAMYHDQGMGPLKLHCFGKGVNISLGLPIVRTSVDHGTAFDIAGKGKADPGSLLFAIKVAEKWARNNR